MHIVSENLFATDISRRVELLECIVSRHWTIWNTYQVII